ncbi:MAG: hypothetical protein ACI3Z7_00685 [Candidatus Aphodosoma sp.]
MKHTVILLALLFAAIYAVAAPADPTPAKVTQPNGDTITIRLVGDEYGSWYETSTDISSKKLPTAIGVMPLPL